MERLTEKYSDGTPFVPNFILQLTNGMQSVVNKLAHYEDLEEQGLLLKLPCKVGDTFFKIICDGVIYELSLNKIMKSKVVDGAYTYCCNVVGREWDVRYIESTDKLIFQTKAEAEKALAEMEK